MNFKIIEICAATERLLAPILSQMSNQRRLLFPEDKCGDGIQKCQQMFCLDLAAAFIIHYQLASRVDVSTQSKPVFAFTSAALSGAAAAVALYPFDVVRQMSVAPGTSHFAFSTIPFMTAYLGIYLLQPHDERRQKPLKDKLAWSLAATTVAAAVEFPFDKAKHNMAGGFRAAALANALRIPLGSLMLISTIRSYRLATIAAALTLPDSVVDVRKVICILSLIELRLVTNAFAFHCV